MKVIVQQKERALFLRRDEQWTPVRSKATEFETAVEAIVFCIHCHTREVKLVARNGAGVDIFLYPFGGDPGVKNDLKKLRRSIKESQRLKTERRLIRARVDSLIASRKELKKQVPFVRQVDKVKGQC
jgi:hypothetical protein